MTIRPYLENMFQLQMNFQAKVGNMPFKSEEQKQRFINLHTLAAINELNEALNETPWKDWKKNQNNNKEQFQKELIDVWKFLINLSIAADLTPEKLYDLFIDKDIIINTRQDGGY